MAVKSKAQLQTDITADPGLSANQKTILGDIVESYANYMSQMDTAQRDGIAAPGTGLIIYNTDNDRYEYWNGAQWLGIGTNVGTPQTVVIQLSSADILALDTTPIQVAPAPGSGFAVVPVSIYYRYQYASVAYTGGSTIQLKCSTKTIADDDPFLGISSLILQAAANRSGALPANTGSGIDAIVENDSLELECGTPFAAGDGALTVWATYTIITY